MLTRLLLLSALFAAPAQGRVPVTLPAEAAATDGVDARTIVHRGDRYRVVTLDLREVRIDLVGQRDDGPHRFADLPDRVPGLVAATNAGIFHTVDEPVGLWVEDGIVQQPYEGGDGVGNFFLLPNGVFSLGARGATVAGTRPPSPVDLATQSGPALLLDGAVHPGFREDSVHRKLRSGVGLSDPWTVHWVVSDGPVRFHDLATLFRDRLGCRDALYLDGTLSDLLAPGFPATSTEEVAGFLVATPRPPPSARLQDGDLVFQRSRSAQSAAIAQATGSPWTHMGLVRLVDGEPWVVEAVQPVRRTRFDAWAQRGQDQAVAVRRHVAADRLWTPAALARLDALTEAWLGRPYDARFAPGDEALYCSELAREAYLGAVGVELAPLRPVASYEVADPALREEMVARWGQVPEELMVVAPSDLLDAAGMRVVPW